jgi:hypothetical protein
MSNVVNIWRREEPPQLELASDEFPIEWVVTGCLIAAKQLKDPGLANQLGEVIICALREREGRITLRSPLLERARRVVDLRDPECKSHRAAYELIR